MKNYILKVQFLIIIVCLFFGPLNAFAAKLYLESDQTEYQPGDTFLVKIRLDTEGECINALGVFLSFPKDVLKVVDFSQGESILTLWTEYPELDQDEGKVSFSGGIPGGYCGIIPGDPGLSNLLGEIIFSVPVTVDHGSAEIDFLNNSQVLLNDGLGTVASLKTEGAIFSILNKGELSKEEWEKELLEDKILPEPFEIEIQKTPEIFEGKYFIVFFTTDKQTGIDYYQIKEGTGEWQIAESPYLLKGQSLKSIIQIKAVDKAGNERMVEYIPSSKIFFFSGIAILVLVLVAIIFYVGYLRKRKKNKI